jgi:hypothetical protein
MVLSIEPFSIAPDIRQSSKLANLWRVAKVRLEQCETMVPGSAYLVLVRLTVLCVFVLQDISGDWGTLTNRADISDKWAPLAGPGKAPWWKGMG